MEDRPPRGFQSPPLGQPDGLDEFDSMDADQILDEIYMSWRDPGEPSDATFGTEAGAPDPSTRPTRYKPRVGAARERNIEVQRRYRQRVKERAKRTEAAIATTAAKLEAARAENAALQAQHDGLESLSDYSYSALAALRTFSATLAATAGQYFHAVQLKMATLHADSIEAMFNAVRRPTDAQLYALAADIDANSPLFGRINIELMAQLVSLMGQWTAAGPHGRVVVERKLKIVFETRERFVETLMEHYPDKAAAMMERLRLQDRAVVQAQAAGGAVAAVAEEAAYRFPLAAFFSSRSALWREGGGEPSKETTKALIAQRASCVAHPDLQTAVQLSEAQKQGLREAWGTYIHIYNSRIRGRVGTAVEHLEAATVPENARKGGKEASLSKIATAQVAGREALRELEVFGREEISARAALTQRAIRVLTPLQTAYIMLMQLPDSDIVSMYKRVLDVKIEELPEAVRRPLSIYFEEDEEEDEE